MELAKTKLDRTSYLSLFSIFYMACLGLGYSTLNRFDPSLLPALSDTIIYIKIVESGILGLEIDQYGRSSRIFIPYLAHLVYLSLPDLGSFSKVFFSLLIVNSFFTSLTAVLFFHLSIKILNSNKIALMTSFIFLFNWVIPNVYLVGLVDASHGFFFSALLYCLLFKKLKWIPLIAILGTANKETFLPLGSIFFFGWIASSIYYDKRVPFLEIFFLLLFIILSFFTLFLIYLYLFNFYYFPWDQMNNMGSFTSTNYDFNKSMSRLLRLFLTTGWLIFLALPYFRFIPKNILISSILASLSTAFLGWWISIGGVGYARGIFSVSAFLLSISAAANLNRILFKEHIAFNIKGNKID